MIQYYLSIYETLNTTMFGLIIFILINISALFVLSLIGYVIFYLCDIINTTIVETDGIVVYKEFGDTINYYNYIEDEYTVRVKYNDIVDKIEVSKNKYDKLKTGDVVKVYYSIGRYTKSSYLDSIKIIEPLTV